MRYVPVKLYHKHCVNGVQSRVNVDLSSCAKSALAGNWRRVSVSGGFLVFFGLFRYDSGSFDVRKFVFFGYFRG